MACKFRISRNCLIGFVDQSGGFDRLVFVPRTVFQVFQAWLTRDEALMVRAVTGRRERYSTIVAILATLRVLPSRAKALDRCHNATGSDL